ncbi:hypothetical protein [Actinomadura hibisca]|uniref:hypothetical protein n=1 Tax=Actinomadura hibisca TaxID=68565 RepID=UPI000AB08AA3|nr:hypothetical protein [Actinomadura hibisca]
MIRNSRRVVALAIAGAVAITPVLSGCGAGTNPQSAAPTRLTEGVSASVPQGADAPKIDVRNMFLLGPKPDTTFNAGSSVPLYAWVVNQVKSGDRLTAVEAPDFAQVKITGGGVALPPAKESGEGSLVSLVGDAAAPSPSATPSGSAKPGEKKAKPGASATPTGAGASPSEGASASASPGAESSNTPSAPASSADVPAAADGKAPLVVLTGLKRTLLGGETLKVTLRFENAGSVTVPVPVIPQQGEYASFTAVSTGVPVPGASSPSPSGSPAGEEAGHEPAAGH